MIVEIAKDKSSINCFIFCSLLLLGVLGSLFSFGEVLVDSGAYIHSVYYFQGKDLSAFDEQRVIGSYAIKRPLTSLGVLLFEPFVGVRWGFALVNTLLYLATTVLVYAYFTRFFDDKLLGYLSAVLFAVSLPAVLYGTMVLSDMSGYFFLILGLLIIDRLLERNTFLNHLLINLYIGIAILSREYGLVLYPYYLLRYFLPKTRTEFKVSSFVADTKDIFQKIPTLSALLISWIPTSLYNYLSKTAVFFAGKASAFTPNKISLFGLLRIIGIMIATLHIATLSTLAGVFLDKHAARRFFYLIFFLSALPLILAGHFLAFLSPRMVFVLFPLVVSSSAYAILKCSEYAQMKWKVSQRWTIVSMLCLYAVISYFGAFIYPSHFELPEDAGFDLIVQKTIESIMFKVGDLL